MIYKVKEPIPVEYSRSSLGQILYTYLHMAAAYARELTDAMIAADIRASPSRPSSSRTAPIRSSSR